MKKRLVYILFAVVVISSVALNMLGCNKTDKEIEMRDDKDSETTNETSGGDVISDTVKGWSISLSDDSEVKKDDISLVVLLEEETSEYSSTKFTIIGNPVKITLGKSEATWLEVPVQINMELLEDAIGENDSLEGIQIAYYNKTDGIWEYFCPDRIDVENAIITFTTSHFSEYAVVNLSRDEQIEQFAERYALAQYQRQSMQTLMEERMGSDIKQMYADLGVQNEDMKQQLMIEVIKLIDEGISVEGADGIGPIDFFTTAATGDKQAFQNKLYEYMGKALANAVQADKEAFLPIIDKMTGQFGNAVNVTDSVSTAAGYFIEGDIKGGLEAVSSGLRSVPYVGIIAAASDLGLNFAIKEMNIWQDNQMNDLYKIYRDGKSSERGLDIEKGDFEALWEAINFENGFQTKKSAGRFFARDAVKAFCEKYNWDESTMTIEEKDKLMQRAKQQLKVEFEARVKAEVEIAAIKENELEFIGAIKEINSLLASYSYEEYFGEVDKNGKTIKSYNVNDRLTRIYNIRNNIVDLIGEEATKNLSPEDMCGLVLKWIQLHTEKGNKIEAKNEFIEYLRTENLLQASLFGSDAGIWMLTSINNYNPESTKTSSYDTSYTNSGNSFTLSIIYVGTNYSLKDLHEGRCTGESIVMTATSTSPPSVLQAGQNITLDLAISTTSHNGECFYWNGEIYAFIDIPGMVGGRTGGARDFYDTEDEYIIYTGKDHGYASNAITVSAEMPGGSKIGDIKSIYVRGMKMQNEYIYTWTTVKEAASK